MTSLLTLDLRGDVEGKVYEGLLGYAVERCTTATLVVRRERDLSDRGRNVLNRLEVFQERRESVIEWPGTVLLGGDAATLHRYRFDLKMVESLVRETDSLFAWRHPHLPEDLCLYRHQGEPWLVTISHERDAYLRVSQQEADGLTLAVPELQSMLGRAT